VRLAARAWLVFAGLMVASLVTFALIGTPAAALAQSPPSAVAPAPAAPVPSAAPAPAGPSASRADLADEALGRAGDLLADMDPAAPPQSGAQTALRILVMMTALSLLPALVLTMTCFTRIVIVFSFLRQALGIQGMPPNQVMVGMALFLSIFIMAPVGQQIHEQAIVPLMDDQISTQEALVAAQGPLAEFMLTHTADADLRLFYEISEQPRPSSREEVSFIVLVPAFVLSEVRTAFQMGFLILIPFMVIDLVVASILMAMGMMMLPPTLIALPVKVMVFVLADGWGLVIGSLARSFKT